MLKNANTTNLEKAEKLALLICNKNVVYDERYTVSQTKKTICGRTSYVDVVHEVAHWIACDPKYRYETNLGLPFNDVKDDDPIHYRMYSEECIAAIITKMLFDKYFLTDDNKDSREYKYMIYMDGYGNNISNIISDLTSEEIRNKSIKLFEEFTKDIIL